MDLKKFLPLIGIVLLLYILASVDRHTIITLFVSLHPFFLFLSFFAAIPVLLLENLEWQLLLKRQKIHVSYGYSFKNLFIGYFYGLATPGGVGAYLRALYLKQKSKAPLPKCLSNIVTLNTIDYLALFFIGAIGALVLSERYPYLFFVIVCVLIMLLLFFLFFLKKETSQPVFTWIIRSRIFHFVRQKVQEPFESFYEDLPGFRDVLLPFLLSLLGWFLSFSEFYLIARFFSIPVSFFTAVFFIAIATVVTMLPLSIYGLGTREGTLIALFSILPVAPATVISLSLYWFVIMWLFPSMIGAVLTLFEHKTIQASLIDKKKDGFS